MILIVAGASALLMWALYRRYRTHRKMKPMDFHWGATPESDAFFDRNPKFYDAFERLMILANKTFGREYQPKDRLQDIAFNLGETCRVDFLEILFLAVHGWGIGASKLVRGLYERAVALAYMIKHPEKAERFVRYAAIQEYKVMLPAVDLAGEEEFDKMMAGTTTVAQIKEFREKIKPEFQVELCKKCHATGTAFSWDENGVVAQARDVGEPYTKFYLGAYAIPNMHVHVSLTSAMQEHDKKPDQERTEQRRQEADFALTNAHAVMLMVIRSQNDLFSLDLEKDIEVCEKDWAIVWGPPSA
jgi:hypothetical protein